MKRLRAWLKEPVKPRTRGSVLLAALLSAAASIVQTLQRQEQAKRIERLERHNDTLLRATRRG
jgi:hypothetical protein